MADTVLTLNAGSSSLKFALFDAEGGEDAGAMLRGMVEEIPTRPRFSASGADGVSLAEEEWPEAAGDFAGIVDRLIDRIEAHLDDDRLIAVGHRVVHGGPDHAKPERVTPALLAELGRLTRLAPLHEPQNIAPIRALAEARPGLTQIACFDTAFHHTMPAVATRYALPRDFEAQGIRRYGFHGLSYEYIAGQLARAAPELAAGRVIVAHLGNGASLCALKAGKSVDTTMGFSTLDGLVMGTRPGSLDPGVILHLLKERGMTADGIEDLLYRRSGLLGVSGGLSSDMRVLLGSDDPRAAEAVELFAYRIAREAGALASSLGGLDGFVFTGGIGEHSSAVRALVCARLDWLGLKIDAEANERGDGMISAPQSPVELRVIATDEERMIASHVLRTVHAGRQA